MASHTYWPILPIKNQKKIVCQVYLPSAMFVIVSWVSFLVKPEVVPGRWEYSKDEETFTSLFLLQDGDVGHPIFSANKYFQQCQV